MSTRLRSVSVVLPAAWTLILDVVNFKQLDRGESSKSWKTPSVFPQITFCHFWPLGATCTSQKSWPVKSPQARSKIWQVKFWNLRWNVSRAIWWSISVPQVNQLGSTDLTRRIFSQLILSGKLGIVTNSEYEKTATLPTPNINFTYLSYHHKKTKLVYVLRSFPPFQMLQKKKKRIPQSASEYCPAPQQPDHRYNSKTITVAIWTFSYYYYSNV